MIVGIGLDIVTVSTFANQLNLPGTTMKQSFTATELSDSSNRTNESRSLAVRWAAKEAVIKAWSVSRSGQPPRINPHLVKHQEIEVCTDQWGRPSIKLYGMFAKEMDGLKIHISLTHDENTAAAVAVIEN